MSLLSDFLLEGGAMTVGKTGVRIEPTVTLGNLLNALVIVGAMTPGMWIAVNYMNRTDETQRTVVELKKETGENFKLIQNQIANLPTQAVRLEKAEDTIRELRQTDRDMGEKIGNLERVSDRNDGRLTRLEKDMPVRQTR